MIADDLRTFIAKNGNMIEFEYNGYDGNIDPYYNPTDGHSYLLYYNGYEILVHTIDEVMNTPFIDGYCLNDISEKLENILSM